MVQWLQWLQNVQVMEETNWQWVINYIMVPFLMLGLMCLREWEKANRNVANYK